MKRILIYIFIVLSAHIYAQEWNTHLAYNNVTQIAMTDELVYAISDGSLFSVNKLTEEIKTYNKQSGLHSSNINCIHYDSVSDQLFIAYEKGKIDILSKSGVQYIGELYDKDMTQEKTIYNVTIYGHTAYLSTSYGVQTFDLRTNRLVNSYWLRPNGLETHVQDVLIANDSIYAFTVDSVFCAALTDNLVDYTYWKRELQSGRISPDIDKGKHYQDSHDHWYAGYTDGIVRFTPTNRLTYKPKGPIVNVPYRLNTSHNRLWVVPGGRWANQNFTPGHVMIYDGAHWTNIPNDSIHKYTMKPVTDFMNVAIDPTNPDHYFVTSYGTGLYEFVGTQCVAHYLPAQNNTLGSAVPNHIDKYTRLDFATFDKENNLWMLNGGTVPNTIVCFDKNRQWHGLPLIVNDERISLATPGGLIIDQHNPNYKWIADARYATMLYLLDDNGSPFDYTDDKTIGRNNWITQDGRSFKPENILNIIQDQQGFIWMATEQGIARIDNANFFTSNLCTRPELIDRNGENPMTNLRCETLCQDKKGQLWVGTQTLGVYVLNHNATEIIAHYTTDNSALPSNSILSLACDEQGLVSIGTGEGLVQYNPTTNKIQDWNNEQAEEEIDHGLMQQWKLHLSYNNPTKITATPQSIFAVADGSLFSIDQQSETIDYWDKSIGLNGNHISHIEYHSKSKQLIICYDDGRIDLLDEHGNVRQMPDLFIKAGSIAVNINCVTVGSKHTYLGMPFGIVAINPQKAEISATYYIGEDAAIVNVKQIVELNDSIFAFTNDCMYSAALTDNLVDYNFWKKTELPAYDVQQAVVWRNNIYSLQHDSLYIREGDNWKLVVPNPLKWIHVSGSQLLTFQSNVGTQQLTEDHQLSLINGVYSAMDAIYSNGYYWLAEEGQGLIRLSQAGDEFFRPDGPMSNFGYRLYVAHDQLYVAPGGRWANEFARYSSLSVYNGQSWIRIPWIETLRRLGKDMRDAVSYAIDNHDPGHFFVGTYGTGVFEFKDYQAIRFYDSNNSTLSIAHEGADGLYYTRTEGTTMDAENNLWVLNATNIGKPLHVMTPNGQWVGLDLYSNGQVIQFTTPGPIWIDQRKPHFKWMIDQRHEPGVILLNDGGTPTYSGDDHCIKRSSFVDQNGKTIKPENIMCLTQDLTNRIWIGTQNGILVIPTGVDFFTSNECKRIIIPRNDGTNTGDYLLDSERINCMVADGGNRMWIGTDNSGLYLIEDDTITVAHFTENNSLLPSNAIHSIAIMPTTGEIFVGTDKGIASYRSDASKAHDNLNNAYAFPNPVKHNYEGKISIAGLMENTMVNIIDAGGNLVCKTKSHGGLAVWDGYLPDGTKAKSGVYSALCNEPNGKNTVVKILFVK